MQATLTFAVRSKQPVLSSVMLVGSVIIKDTGWGRAHPCPLASVVTPAGILGRVPPVPIAARIFLSAAQVHTQFTSLQSSQILVQKPKRHVRVGAMVGFVVWATLLEASSRHVRPVGSPMEGDIGESQQLQAVDVPATMMQTLIKLVLSAANVFRFGSLEISEIHQLSPITRTILEMMPLQRVTVWATRSFAVRSRSLASITALLVGSLMEMDIG